MSFNHSTLEMETELDPFSFTDLNHTPMESRSQNPDAFSSWLEMDDIYAPTIPDDSQDLHLLGDHSFHHVNTDADSEPSSILPLSHNYSESLLLHLCDFNTPTDIDEYYPILPELSAIVAPTTAEKPAAEEVDGDLFLNDDLYLITPAESHESSDDQLHAHMSTSTTAAAAVEDSCPQNSKSITEVTRKNQDKDEEEEVETDDDQKPGTLNCKNLVSERNRRKRLSQQLLALRALVPNITKMDKRSVLVDALGYLKSIHEETERLQRELKESSSSRANYDSCGIDGIDRSLLPSRSLTPRLSDSKLEAQILEIDAEKIEERRFVIKIHCKGEAGIGGEVLRVIESLGLEITYVALEQIKPLHVLTTVFVRVRKQGRMTEEKLKNSITSTALRSGLTLQSP